MSSMCLTWLNLLLRITLDKEGNSNHFSNNTWKMIKDAMIDTRGHICETLYKIQLKIYANSLKIYGTKDSVT